MHRRALDSDRVGIRWRIPAFLPPHFCEEAGWGSTEQGTCADADLQDARGDPVRITHGDQQAPVRRRQDLLTHPSHSNQRAFRAEPTTRN